MKKNHKLILFDLFFIGLFLASSWGDEIGVFYALEQDWGKLKSQAQYIGITKVGNRSIETIRLGSHQIYGIKMGAGVVESAISAQALLGRFRCDLAISLGPIGALSDELKIGQWCLITNVVAYQKGTQTRAAFQASEKSYYSLPFPARLKEAGVENSLKLKKISVASGEMFIASESFQKELQEKTQAQAVDMNLFGLLSAFTSYASAQGLPHIALRVVSDEANDSATQDFKTFVASYKGEGGATVAQLITNLPSNPNSPDTYPTLRKMLKSQN